MADNMKSKNNKNIEKIDINKSIKMITNREFMKTLKFKVDKKVPSGKKRDITSQYIKGLIVVSWVIVAYLSLYIITNPYLAIFVCAILGLGHTAIGFNILHDAIHGSFSYNQNINKFLSFFSCSLLGVSHMLWKHKHNYLHHQYPNIQNIDDDLETRGGLRLSPHQPKLSKYKYQHLYAPFIYGLTTLEWVFIKDFVQYFTLRMNEFQSIPKFKKFEHIEFWVSKLIFFILYVIIPLNYFSISHYIIGTLIINFFMSVSMAIIFQLAHVMEQSKFPLSTQIISNNETLDWAQLQLQTTVNFAPNNPIVTWYAGGLNFQVEHHLFPNMCHSNYPIIAPLVKETAKEFGFPYHSVDSWFGAIKNHFSVLKKLGQECSI